MHFGLNYRGPSSTLVGIVKARLLSIPNMFHDSE